MSTTTIDYTAIDGTEDGVNVLADIKAQIQNAQNDMQDRTADDQAASITALWTFGNLITADGAPAGSGWLKAVHAGVMGGNTLDNSLLIRSAADYTNTIFRPFSDGVAVSADDFQYEHDNALWAFLGKVRVDGVLDLNGNIELAAQTISGNPTVTGFWTYTSSGYTTVAGAVGLADFWESSTSAQGEGLSMWFSNTGDDWYVAPVTDTNGAGTAWSLARGLHWDFPTDEWQIGDDAIWNNGNFPVTVTSPSTGQVLKWDGSKWTNQSLSASGIVDFKIVDGDTTVVTMGDNNYIKFVEGAGISINFTDTSTGSSSDPFDLTIGIDNNLISGEPELTSGLLATDELLVSNGGILNRMDISVLSDYLNVPDNAIQDTDFSADGIMVRTASGVYTSRTIVNSDGTLSISNGNGDAGNPTLSVIGVDGQKVSIQTTAPSSPSTNDIWIDVS